MTPVSLCKYFNFIFNTTTGTDHINNINYNANYNIIIVMIIFFISLCYKRLKTYLFYLS